MEISQILKQRPIAIENSKNKPIATATERNNIKPIAIDDKQIDSCLKEYSHLISQDWKAWHAKWIKQNGIAKWTQLARIAQAEGKDKPRYFSFLLNKETK